MSKRSARNKQNKVVIRNKAARDFCKALNIKFEGSLDQIANNACEMLKKTDNPYHFPVLMEMVNLVDLDEKPEAAERKEETIGNWVEELALPHESTEEASETAAGSREPETEAEEAGTVTKQTEAEEQPSDPTPSELGIFANASAETGTEADTEAGAETGFEEAQQVDREFNPDNENGFEMAQALGRGFIPGNHTQFAL